MSLRHMQVLIAVAGEGTVSAAAGQLHLSQPAVSMALAELERLLGEAVFDRVAGRLHLNERGRELLPRAREIAERFAAFAGSAATGEALAGTLTLGTSNTVGNYLAGELLGGFVAAHPRVAIRIAVGNTADISRGVLEHRFDAGFIEGPIADPALQVHLWRRDALAVCVRPGHPLAARRRLQPAHFAGERWVLRERGSATRAQAERVLSSLPPAAGVLELDQTEAIKQVVIAGLGIACLPRVAIGDAVAAGRLVALHTPFLDLERQLGIVLHQGRYRGAALTAFLAGLGVGG
ncbi:LysR family transcriptional regulator [Pinirhizobacter sp.]|uniref:LysR family transcriptional regulator n=1 Tax=Pinirhizobacter sp. TaxID=2950432 RepID=UPI0039C8DC54